MIFKSVRFLNETSISDFVDTAIKIDSRNKFSTYDGDLSNIPSTLRNFYKNYNPEDVEIGMVRFVPANRLESVAKDYEYIEPDCVFAMENGDPIFLKNGKVYTIPHGVRNPKLELKANSFNDYLHKLFEEKE